MKNDKIIIINGRKYDSVTGVPLSSPLNSPKPDVSKEKLNSNRLHTIAQKSQTLYRKATQKPIGQGKLIVHKVGKTMDIAKSKSISHFSSIQSSITNRQKDSKIKTDIPTVKHPVMTKIEEKNKRLKDLHNTKLDISKPAQPLKEETIAQAINEDSDKTSDKKASKNNHRFLKLSIFSVAIIIAVGFLVYFFLPSFSVKIASTQAGIDATYPEYCPDGYRLSGPVYFNDGEVIINFHANTGKTKFTIKQSKSSWDSSAVKVKVEADSGGEFSTTSEKGLTIFSYNGSAIWVNGGILYTITGDAPLSGDQIRRIATSL